ncbi:heterocycloanthracin/sonorensin family bacteriocin [Bacillus benzoevorans]|uniref:Heterocycloanthracin/sonorensin family bacteriocin n=1 Tax=Bacillus benzoevorans TaxID=1456 RepID=A0A7X0HRC2_9BACI|nr:heterocycloanthracin/sonorensin family bacteriocin [Bacillus benzoevorans]MBB6445321.1 heterocycloanthracin/sonorensin family bacteriocin [Bacillus benzoevorans]
MYNFQNELQMLNVDNFQASEPITWDYTQYGTDEERQFGLGLGFTCFSCFNCSNCFNCFRCSNCFNCSNCFHCSNCHRCSSCGGRCGGGGHRCGGGRCGGM